MDTIVNRLKEVIEKHGDSHAVLADKIGVQRANVSHVFSGRNKPSLDFVLRVIKCYPEVNADWLLLGKEPAQTKPVALDDVKTSRPNPSIESPLETESKLLLEKKTNSNSNLASEIEQIIVFYKDRSFKEYKPS